MLAFLTATAPLLLLLLLPLGVSAETVPAVSVGPGMREAPEAWFAANVQGNFVYSVDDALQSAVDAMPQAIGFAADDYDSVTNPELKGLGISTRTLYLGPCIMRSPFMTPSGGFLYITAGSNITFGFVANNTSYERGGLKQGDLVTLYPGTVGYAVNWNCEPFTAFSVYTGDGSGPIFPMQKFFPGFPTQFYGPGALLEAHLALGNGGTTAMGPCLAQCGLPAPPDSDTLNVTPTP